MPRRTVERFRSVPSRPTAARHDRKHRSACGPGPELNNARPVEPSRARACRFSPRNSSRVPLVSAIVSTSSAYNVNRYRCGESPGGRRGPPPLRLKLFRACVRYVDASPSDLTGYRTTRRLPDHLRDGSGCRAGAPGSTGRSAHLNSGAGKVSGRDRRQIAWRRPDSARFKRVAVSRQEAGALTVLRAVVCLMFGFFGFAVAFPGPPL
jgi:hypothetical protein